MVARSTFASPDGANDPPKQKRQKISLPALGGVEALAGAGA
jgi:hypothetical protein